MEMNLVPLTQDLTTDTHKLDIILGLEEAMRRTEDVAMAAGESFEEGDWAVKNDSQELATAGGTGVANTYPIWAGNADRYDVHATGKCTIIPSTQFVYRTTKFGAGTYHAGDLLTVKGGKVPVAAGVGDAVLAKVHRAPVDGVMEIAVL